MKELAEFLTHPLTGIFHDKSRHRRVALWGGHEVGWIADEAIEATPAALREFEKMVWRAALLHYGAPRA